MAVPTSTKRWIAANISDKIRYFHKVHALMDVDSKAVLAFETTASKVHEVNHLEPLLDQLGCTIGDACLDAGYISNHNVWLIEIKGGTAFIRPKSTNLHPKRTSKRSRRLHRMVQDYLRDPEAWMRRYHRRSLVEGLFSAIKRRLGEGVRATKRFMQRIEIALKMLAYNLALSAPLLE